MSSASTVWYQDPGTNLGVPPVSGDPFDDHPGHDVVGVRVTPVRAGGEQRRMPDRGRHQLCLGVVVEAVRPELIGRRQHGEVVEGVVETAGLLQYLTYGDVPAVVAVAVAVDDSGQPAFDRVVQPDPALADELEQHHRRERLRLATDPEVPVDRHRRAGVQVGTDCAQTVRTARRSTPAGKPDPGTGAGPPRLAAIDRTEKFVT
jgi:hypothetical protein